ncbi:MAG: hypothetical protein RLZZ53_341 [Acidobacteriota bacterium]|jgi:hypothetical protein
MRLVLLQTWKGFRAGKTIDPPDGVGNLLVRRKIAKPAPEEIEQATAVPQYERAVRRQNRGR